MSVFIRSLCIAIAMLTGGCLSYSPSIALDDTETGSEGGTEVEGPCQTASTPCDDTDPCTTSGVCNEHGECTEQLTLCIHDPEHNLYWQRESAAVVYSDALFAMGDCQDLVVGHFDDWRLPTVDEMRTLIRGCPNSEDGSDCPPWISDGSWHTSPECDGCSFGDGPASGCYWIDSLVGGCSISPFWTSSLVNLLSTDRWTVDFQTASFSAPQGMAAFRCVRSGE